MFAKGCFLTPSLSIAKKQNGFSPHSSINCETQIAAVQNNFPPVWKGSIYFMETVGVSFANAFSSSPFQDFCGLVHYSMLLFGFLPVTWSSAGRRESCLSYSLLFFFSILQDKKMDSSHPFAVECRGCMSAFIRNLPIFRLLLFLSSLAVILRVSDCEISREPTTQPIDFLYDVRHWGERPLYFFLIVPFVCAPQPGHRYFLSTHKTTAQHLVQNQAQGTTCIRCQR